MSGVSPNEDRVQAKLRTTFGRGTAVQLFSESLDRDDRILVTGATGWFGRTLLRLVPHSHMQSLMLLMGGGAQTSVGVDGREYPLQPWNEDDVRDFRPTLVFNFGYVTREGWSSGSDRVFVETNTSLTNRLLWLAGLPSVRLTVTVSSGAALTQQYHDNPYGRLKAWEECRFLGTHRGPSNRLVLRTWSVTGGLVRNPGSYLFSNLLSQASTGLVKTYSNHLVWRRYSLVDDVLAVALSLGSSGHSGVLDTGGPLIEARKLASIIADRFNCGVLLPVHQEGRSDVYCSDGRSWQSACEALDYRPADLDEQIELSALDLM